MRRLLFQAVHDVALMPGCEQDGREAILCQTVKAPHAPGGYDAAKRAKDRKRRIAVGTDGRLLMVNLATAG